MNYVVGSSDYSYLELNISLVLSTYVKIVYRILLEYRLVSSKVGCLLHAVGKQPSLPLINLGKNSRYDDDDDIVCNKIQVKELIRNIRLTSELL